MTLKDYLHGNAGESTSAITLSNDALRSKLDEITVTENNYAQDLRFVVDSFLTPMREMISMDQIRAVFSNTEQLLELHMGIDAELQSSAGTATAELLQQISASFEKRIPFFKMYAQYSSNYVTAASKLHLIRNTDEKVAEFLKEIETQYSTTLLALLIRPVQRICQYPLLFREVTGHLVAVDEGIDNTIILQARPQLERL